MAQDKKADADAYDTDVQAIRRFRIEMRRGDIVVAPDGYHRFRAVGEITGDYEFQRREDGFHHRRAIRWHWHVSEREGDPGSVFMEGRFHWPPVNLMAPANPNGLLRYLSGIDNVTGALPHVLVIDEINRANISKVMGELITLLEEDKRESAENEVAVTLPYSGAAIHAPGEPSHSGYDEHRRSFYRAARYGSATPLPIRGNSSRSQIAARSG